MFRMTLVSVSYLPFVKAVSLALVFLLNLMLVLDAFLFSHPSVLTTYSSYFHAPNGLL